MREFFSPQGVFRTRNLVIMALMVALRVVLSFFNIHITPSFRPVSFVYLPGAVVAALFGPWAGIAFGFVSDTVGFIARPGAGYFPGYAISEMVSNLIYAAFLFRRPASIPRVLLSKVLILVLVTLGLNFLWQSILFGAAAGTYFTSARVFINLALLPVHTALTVLFVRLCQMVEKRSPNFH